MDQIRNPYGQPSPYYELGSSQLHTLNHIKPTNGEPSNNVNTQELVLTNILALRSNYQETKWRTTIRSLCMTWSCDFSLSTTFELRDKSKHSTGKIPRTNRLVRRFFSSPLRTPVPTRKLVPDTQKWKETV